MCKVITDKRELPAQLVIFAAGFLPNGQLARDAGLEVAPFGAIVVNEKMQTSDPDIYAGGDCVAIKNLITGKLGYLPLGSMANRQGRVIGTNLAGGDASFPGFVGTWAVKLFDMSFCGAGLTVERARREGYDAISVAVEQLDRAHFYPEKHMMSLELVVDRSDRRVLGIQGACTAGDALKARVDAVAAVLQYGKPTVEDISNLEVSYAPPFAAAMDVVNVVGNVADNVLAGRVKPITAEEFMDLWNKRAENNVFFIDARPAKAGQAVQAQHPEWHSISLEEMPSRVSEVPRDRPVAIICNTGLRAYDSVLIPARNGITDVVNAAGGMQAVLKTGGKDQPPVPVTCPGAPVRGPLLPACGPASSRRAGDAPGRGGGPAAPARCTAFPACRRRPPPQGARLHPGPLPVVPGAGPALPARPVPPRGRALKGLRGAVLRAMIT